MENSFLLTAAAWATYYALHSLFAATATKQLFKRLGGLYRFYRLTYVLFSTALLLPLVYAHWKIWRTWLMEPAWWLQLFGVLVALGGLLIVKQAFRNYHTAAFLGIAEALGQQGEEAGGLTTTGWNGVVRHPLYFGTLFVLLGALACWPTGEMLVMAVTSIAYIFIGATLEERKLVAQFGDAYRAYQERVPMIFPARGRRR